MKWSKLPSMPDSGKLGSLLLKGAGVMKITNDGISNVPVPARESVQPASNAAPETASNDIAPDAGGYTPSPEWTLILANVRQQPEIREDRVQAVLERLQDGSYLTPDAAEKTADAMMQAMD